MKEKLIKVDNFPFDKVYFGSPQKYGDDITLDRPLFVSPYKGIASIFIGDANPKTLDIPPGSYNFNYKEWSLDKDELDEPFEVVHLTVEGLPELKEREIVLEGYIYSIDVSELKDHIYRYEWMSDDVEFLLSDISKIAFDSVTKHKVRYIKESKTWKI